MRETTLRQRLLREAAKLIGHEELAVRLKVPIHLLDAWMAGNARMTDRKFVMLADILDKIANRK